ncbi:MAG TPA: hypothetical protein VIU61_30570 [Kofleriaceae bacterium]
MKLRSLCFVLALAGGCAKSNDVAPLQQEATSLAAYYTQQIDALERRAQELEKRLVQQRGNPNIAEAVRLFNEARGKLAELRGMAQKAPGAIAMASGGAKDPVPAKGSGEPAPDPDPKWKLERLIDEMKERFALSIVEANSRLDATETWIHEAERYVPPAQIAPTEPATDEAPAPAPAGDPAAAPPAGAAETPAAPTR